MAASSTYFQLSSSILLEYRYRDQGSVDNQYTTIQAPWYLMENEHDDSISIFNSDPSTNVTGNVRTRMGVQTDTTLAQYGYLDLSSGITPLNDYDPKLTNSVDLPVGFTATQVVSYDTVRLHFTQGFNFENNLGFLFKLSLNNVDGKKVNYLNVAYNPSNTYFDINSNPFLFGGRYYASYIEFQVPALYNLQEEYRNGVATSDPNLPDFPSVKLTGGGPDLRSKIMVDFSFISTEKKINSQDYFNCYDFVSFDLPTLDGFAGLSAVVQSASDGDYIELYAAYDGNIIDNFITSLNNTPGNDYIILHDLTLLEYIWPAGGSTASWIKTGGLEFVQDSNYEDPILYRPIVQNSSAVAYRLDYTVRLYNRSDSSSIWKSASAQFSDGYKYGKNLRRINLGTNPIQPKVYNKIYDKKFTVNGQLSTGEAVATGEGYARFVTSFLNTNNIVLSSQNAFLQRNPNTGNVEITTVGNSQSEVIYAQGLSKIALSSTDNFFKFVIYKSTGDNSINFMDLTGLGKLYINFFSDSSETKRYLKFDSPQIAEANGEVLFKIPEKDAKMISNFTNKQYTITSDNGEAVSELYTGTFYPTGQRVDSFLDLKIANLEEQIKELTQLNSSLNTLYNDEVSKTTELKDANKLQNSKIQDLQRELALQIQENNALIEDDEIDEKEKAKLLEDIERLQRVQSETAAQLSSAQNEVTILEGQLQTVNSSVPNLVNLLQATINNTPQS